jgi:hypothetical protein
MEVTIHPGVIAALAVTPFVVGYGAGLLVRAGSFVAAAFVAGYRRGRGGRA